MTKDTMTAVGRRKTASARVRLTPAKEASVTVNGVDALQYFGAESRALIALGAFAVEGVPAYTVEAKVQGGGKNAQAEAVRHAISRALESNDKNLRSPLKKLGYLKRDPRAKERKKPGLKKARKRPQWSKR